MHEHYVMAHTAMRLTELRAEADRERLAASVRPARRGWSWTAAFHQLSARVTVGAPTDVVCCA